MNKKKLVKQAAEAKSILENIDSSYFREPQKQNLNTAVSLLDKIISNLE